LTHREVETLFHEFGHLLHHCFSRVSVRSLAGTNVAWDFVELPSQIMENWCWERSGLDLFAAHHETGERITDELYDKMVRARTYRAANAQMRQLGFAAVDLALHQDYEPGRDGDVMAYAREILQAYSPTKLPEDYSMLAGFSHVFAHPIGYAAGYYSYKWAEVLDADAFTRFKKEGITSAEVGRAFRQAILCRGNSEEPEKLYQDFMGRDPRLEPLLERAGLL
jgi:oligopeptidase A